MVQPVSSPDFLFEVSWEVCNKVGGIYTVISTKAKTIADRYGDRFITIGPDIWRGSSKHPDFTEDTRLFRSWREHAAENGLNIKTGRWNIDAEPLAILVDFSPSLIHKNEIFAALYQQYGLDSLTGNWDYIEPALFGYYAGKVIKSFYDYYLPADNKVVAQFHEWMSGAGILYLKKEQPAIASVFIAHATVTGRALAGAGQFLSGQLGGYDGDAKAAEFNIRAKHSLEKTAAREADCFAAVSSLTALECRQLLQKDPDIVTPDGFDETIIPSDQQLEEKRLLARKQLLAVAAAATGQPPADDALLVAISGRYEFRNKGIDLFIDALADLNNRPQLQKDVIAFILVPAAHTGPRETIINRLQHMPDSGKDILLSTHHLQHEQEDRIIAAIRGRQLLNTGADKVKVIFAPVYLDGNDGIFNLSYYDLLAGLDMTVFPSFYEPWGYTPLESLAWHVPTVTTTLSGFGRWIRQQVQEPEDAVLILERKAGNDQEVAEKISKWLLDASLKKQEEILKIKERASRLLTTVSWKQLISYYEKAWSIALGKLDSRADLIREKARPKEMVAELLMEMPAADRPSWKKIYISPVIPAVFRPLEQIAANLWWSWNEDAWELFRIIDPVTWEASGNNPVVVLKTQPVHRYEALQQDKDFMLKLETVSRRFNQYRSARPDKAGLHVAYFCMEYGLHASLKLYSGGLGILAGDFLKEASDQGYDITGIGLLYQFGYLKQRLSPSREQIADRDENKFTHLPLSPVRDEKENWKSISISLPGRELYAKIWKADIGRVTLYLLDTDVPENNPADRMITDQLYSGNSEHRLLQELLLGIGGIKLLDACGIQADIFHLNEGHAALAGIERLRKYIQEEHLSFAEALELVRATSLFTTHTPVAAGHDKFGETLMREYLSHYPGLLSVSWEQFMGLGRINAGDHNELFSMSHLAIRLSQEVNAVSKVHEQVTKKMFSPLWKGYEPGELFIGHITNGVHLPTWAAPGWKALLSGNNASAGAVAAKIHTIKTQLKKQFIEYLKNILENQAAAGQYKPQLIMDIFSRLKEDTLMIGFARRFTSYKRPTLLFTDLQRLSAIISNKEKPVLFIFAGKAHPNDKEGQDLLKSILEISVGNTALAGRVIFLENYNMELALQLIQGVDVWLNTPERLSEACGTSGMKAAMNGTLNLSVPDGWWAEAYQENAGWSLPLKPTYKEPTLQNELDAAVIYKLLEEQIIPAFYERNEQNIPEKWLDLIRHSFYYYSSHFAASRMIAEYYSLYGKLYERSRTLMNEHYYLARQLAAWKKKVAESWDFIEIKKVEVPDFEHQPLPLGNLFEARISISTGMLSPGDLGIEAVFAKKNEEGEVEVKLLKQLSVIQQGPRETIYACSFMTDAPGVYHYGFRLYPQHELLPNRQDFGFVKWI